VRRGSSHRNCVLSAGRRPSRWPNKPRFARTGTRRLRLPSGDATLKQIGDYCGLPYARISRMARGQPGTRTTGDVPRLPPWFPNVPRPRRSRRDAVLQSTPAGVTDRERAGQTTLPRIAARKKYLIGGSKSIPKRALGSADVREVPTACGLGRFVLGRPDAGRGARGIDMSNLRDPPKRLAISVVCPYALYVIDEYSKHTNFSQ
jgi:hypothetical protein